jgi:hypothetical protein
MGVPEPLFSAHTPNEHILTASSRGTAGPASLQSITHHELAPTHIQALYLIRIKSRRCITWITQSAFNNLQRWCHKHTIFNSKHDKKYKHWPSVNNFYTHDIIRPKQQRSGLPRLQPQAFCISITTFVNTNKHKVLWASSALLYRCKVASTTNKKDIIEWSWYMHIINYYTLPVPVS